MQCELLGILATTDEEGDELPFDSKLRGCQSAEGVIPLKEGIDESFAPKPIDMHLSWQSALGRTRTKGFTGNGPGTISIVFKIGDQDVIGICGVAQYAREEIGCKKHREDRVD